MRNKIAKRGQNRPTFCVLYAKKYNGLKKLHYRGLWLISAMVIPKNHTNLILNTHSRLTHTLREHILKMKSFLLGFWVLDLCVISKHRAFPEFCFCWHESKKVMINRGIIP